jgi:predicted esterase
VTETRTAPQPHSHHLRVQRTARYYTLGGESGAPKTVWFVLHGFGQLAGQFIRYFADLSDADTLVVAPEAMNRFYLTGTETPARDRPVGATWMTREDRDSEIADYVEYLDALHAEVTESGSEGPSAINVIGFSQGAATATRWVEHGSGRIDRLVLWGGLMPPETDLTRPESRLRRTPLLFVVGSRDKYIDEDMIAKQRERLDAAGVTYQIGRFEGGHVISRSAFSHLRTPG